MHQTTRSIRLTVYVIENFCPTLHRSSKYDYYYYYFACTRNQNTEQRQKTILKENVQLIINRFNVSFITGAQVFVCGQSWASRSGKCLRNTERYVESYENAVECS